MEDDIKTLGENNVPEVKKDRVEEEEENMVDIRLEEAGREYDGEGKEDPSWWGRLVGGRRRWTVVG